jgi:hypothetical protein
MNLVAYEAQYANEALDDDLWLLTSPARPKATKEPEPSSVPRIVHPTRARVRMAESLSCKTV